jgi:hypothetical protein
MQASARSSLLWVGPISLCALVLSAGPPAATARPAASPSSISWADRKHRHGWAIWLKADSGGWCPSRYPAPRLCTTEDGGKHWHGILYGDFNRVLFLTRSSRDAGFAVVARDEEKYPVVTLDNGRHWYAFSRLFNAERLWKKRGRIFWKQGELVFKLGGWPPRNAHGACPKHTWVSGIHLKGPEADICWSNGALAGRISGVSNILVRAPDTSISSWADAKHGFATDPAGAKWRCTPKDLRSEGEGIGSVFLCGTEDGGKHWHLVWAPTEQSGSLDKALSGGFAIEDVWRGPVKDGAIVFFAWQDGGYSLYSVEVTHDSGAAWERNDVFYDGMSPSCDPASAEGTLCAVGPHFPQDHAQPVHLKYNLGICISMAAQDLPGEMGTCGTLTYTLQGWPAGPLAPLRTDATAPDGSGMVTTPTRSVSGGSQGNTIVFTYRVAGFTSDGAVTITVPAGWSPPSLDGSSPGSIAASAGMVDVSGQTIVVSGLTLTPRDSLSITYGARALGGPGATASPEGARGLGRCGRSRHPAGD